MTDDVTIALEDGTNFELPETTVLTPVDVNGGTVAQFTLALKTTNSGIYEDFVLISGAGLGDRTVTIPVLVNYTRPYVKLKNTVDPLDAIQLPVSIPVEVEGILNSTATIALATGTHYTLSTTGIAPEDLAEGATLAFEVQFTGQSSGDYEDEIVITNSDIETLRIPLLVKYRPVGITSVAGDAVVFVSGNVLYVTGVQTGSPLTVINVSGQTVFTATVKSAYEQYNFNVPTGAYVVKAGNTNWKVLK